MRIGELLAEAVPLHLAKFYRRAWDPRTHADLFRSLEADRKDRNAYRLYYKLEGECLPLPQDLLRLFSRYGYHPEDFEGCSDMLEGSGWRGENEEGKPVSLGVRRVRAGRLLRKLLELGLITEDEWKEYSRSWEAWARQVRPTGRWMMVSRHPHDLAGASYDRPWPSCLRTLGEEGDDTWCDVEAGTLVAYEIDEGDWNARNAHARVRIHRFENVDDPNRWIFVPGPTYGSSSVSFARAVREWVERVNGERQPVADELFRVAEPIGNVDIGFEIDRPLYRERTVRPQAGRDYRFGGRTKDVEWWEAGTSEGAAFLLTAFQHGQAAVEMDVDGPVRIFRFPRANAVIWTPLGIFDPVVGPDGEDPQAADEIVRQIEEKALESPGAFYIAAVRSGYHPEEVAMKIPGSFIRAVQARRVEPSLGTVAALVASSGRIDDFFEKFVDTGILYDLFLEAMEKGHDKWPELVDSRSAVRDLLELVMGPLARDVVDEFPESTTPRVVSKILRLYEDEGMLDELAQYMVDLGLADDEEEAMNIIEQRM